MDVQEDNPLLEIPQKGAKRHSGWKSESFSGPGADVPIRAAASLYDKGVTPAMVGAHFL